VGQFACEAGRVELSETLIAQFDAAEVEELGGGHQSRVFRMTRHDRSVVVAKVHDAEMVDRRELEVRVEVTRALAELDPRVCRPLSFGGPVVTDVVRADGGGSYVVCFELADGLAVDPSDPYHAEWMGAELAVLHASMRELPPVQLPVVAALRGVATSATVTAAGLRQLLHGDYNASNLVDKHGVMRIFDFDDCGYGPPAFDVANALYMVLFDAVVQGNPELYPVFRTAFVSGYVDAGGEVTDDELDRLIDVRVDALRGWLHDLPNAPIGIRTASDEWLATLRTFVTNQRPMSH
jgi:Ser/Thr protein kinase RdoA (MazF antagonist)